MSVKEAFQDEFVTKFLSVEDVHNLRLEQAYVNESTEGFQWYGEAGGPAKTHKFAREQLDKEIARTTQTSERMAKNAADTVTSRERAYNIRYCMTPLGQIVRARVRRDQMRLAAITSRELLEANIT